MRHGRVHAEQFTLDQGRNIRQHHDSLPAGVLTAPCLMAAHQKDSHSGRWHVCLSTPTQSAACQHSMPAYANCYSTAIATDGTAIAIAIATAMLLKVCAESVMVSGGHTPCMLLLLLCY